MEKIVIGLEMQIPYEDGRCFDVFLKWLKNYRPDKVVMIGDFLDVPGPSSWNKGTAMEYAGTLQREADKGHDYLDRLLSSFTGDVSYHVRANHEVRIQSYIDRYAPALSGIRGLSISSLLQLDKLGIRELGLYERLAPGVLTSHGDREPISKIGGCTALAGARNKGQSMVTGHTHRHGVVYERFGMKTIFGMETGHMMDVRKASYIKNGNPNWSQGWGVVEVDGKRVHPAVVTYRDGRVSWDG